MRLFQFALFAVLTSLAASAYAMPGISYEGKLLDSTSSPVQAASVLFKLQIRTPGTENCLMYEETKTVNMSGSGGDFALTLNDGTGSRTDSSGYALPASFSNLNPSFGFSPGTCTGALTYSPGPNDGRKLVMSFSLDSGSTWETFPAQDINYSPLAFYAQQAGTVGAFNDQSLVRVTSGGSPSPVSSLTTVDFSDLQALIAGTSPKYQTVSLANGAKIPTYSATPSAPVNGSIWYNTTSNTLNSYINGSPVTLGAGGSGTVTSVATGAGLTGGPIAAAGTISIAAGGVSSSMIASSAITSAHLSPSIAITTTSNITTSSNVTTSGTGNIGAGVATPAVRLDVAGTMKLGDGGETCTAPLGGGVRYNGGNIQFCNGTSWTTLGVAGSGITALTGDVTATGSGSVASTVAQVGGVTAANVATGANLANAATNVNTVSTLVKRDASGNFAAGAVTSTSHVLKDTGANTVTVSAPTTVTTSYSLKLPTAVAASAGQVLASDTSGNMSWSSLPTALPPNGAAGGDLSGTYPNPTVATVGTSTAANVHSAELAANAATAVNTVSTIVKRDGSGNFASNVATVNGVALNNAGSILNITNPVGGAWNMTLPATAGSNGQVMQTNGSGVMSWAQLLTPSTAFVNGGNSFGGNAAVGTNDAYRLDLKTNNAARMTIGISGSVGIGTTSPASSNRLDIVGAATGTAVRVSDNAPSNRIQLNNTSGTSAGSGFSFLSNMTPRWEIFTDSSNSGAQDFVIYDDVSAAPRFYIDPVGNIGIGMTSPAYRLDVSGPVRLGTLGTQITSMGACVAVGTTTAVGGNLQSISCTGVPQAAAVNCSPSGDPGASWGAYATTLNSVSIRFSGTPGATVSWKCSWVVP